MPLETNMNQLAGADWENLEKDVVMRIRWMAITACAMSKPPHRPEIADKIANDLFLPNLRLLAMFCEAVEITDGDPPVVDAVGK